MRRTQVYLDDELWNALHVRAQSQETTVTELVRTAVRDRYLGERDVRAKAMQDFVGIRKGRRDKVDSTQEVRNLRRGGRLERLYGK